MRSRSAGQTETLPGKKMIVEDLYQAIMVGAVERVRQKIMTVVAIMPGLLPIMWNTDTGSEVMRRIAAPMVGGDDFFHYPHTHCHPGIFYAGEKQSIRASLINGWWWGGHKLLKHLFFSGWCYQSFIRWFIAPFIRLTQE